MNNQNIGIFIKKLREEKNITQQELADKLHISRQAVSKWELGIDGVNLYNTPTTTVANSTGSSRSDEIVEK